MFPKCGRCGSSLIPCKCNPIKLPVAKVVKHVPTFDNPTEEKPENEELAEEILSELALTIHSNHESNLLTIVEILNEHATTTPTVSIAKDELAELGDHKVQKQNNRSTHCCECGSTPIQIAVYRNDSSGNFFTAKACLTATNKVTPKSVYVDENGFVCIEMPKSEG